MNKENWPATKKGLVRNVCGRLGMYIFSSCRQRLENKEQEIEKEKERERGRG